MPSPVGLHWQGSYMKAGVAVLLKLAGTMFWGFSVFVFSVWLQLWHADIPGPGFEPLPQPWQCQILHPLGHQGTPTFLFLLCGLEVTAGQQGRWSEENLEHELEEHEDNRSCISPSVQPR